MNDDNKKKLLTIAATSGLAALLLAGCGAPESTSASGTNASKEGGSITIDANQNVKDLDPALAYDTESDTIVEQIYDRLLTYDGSTNKLVSMAASNYDVSKDGLTYTFHIRKGMKFTNGDAVTAQSFADEMLRVLSPKVNSPGEGFLDPIVKGSTAYFKGQAKSVSGIQVIDPNTLQITLTKPEAFFPQVIAMPFFSAVDVKYINQAGSTNFDTSKAMGSGPFELASDTPNQVVLKKNPNYWLKDKAGNALPYLNQVTINYNSNSQLDALDFEHGTTAFMGYTMSGIPSDVYPAFSATPTLKSTIMKEPANETSYIALNNSIKPFDNVKVRVAVEYAVDKQKLVKLLNARVTPANQPLPPGITGYVKTLDANATYTLDDAKAKQLLAEAGYPDGFSTKLYTTNDSDSMKIATSVQYDLSQIGVTVHIVPEAWNTFLTEEEKGNIQPMSSTQWLQDFPDASDFLNTLFNSNQAPANNVGMYHNPQVDSWLNQAQTDTNQTERNALYAKVTNQVMKDAAWIPLYNTENDFAVQSWVHGFYISPTLLDPLQYVWIDPSHQN